MTPQEHFEARFSELEKEFEAGHLPALFDAVREAQVNGLVLPEWAALAVLNMIIERFNAAGGKKQRSQYVVDYAHFLRWDTLRVALRARGVTLSGRRGSPKKDERGIQAARKAAADRLRNTVAECEPRQVQRSYDLVEKARATGDGARFTFAAR